MSTRSAYIVEDDDSVRASLHGLLSVQANLLIHSFRSGEAFLEQAAELEPGCLLLDLQMPGCSGLDVLAAIAVYERKFAAIMLTGQGDIAIAVQAMKLGAIDFLEKPCDFAQLLTCVEAAFSGLEESHQISGRAGAATAKIARLSGRETDVLKGLIDGRSNKVIALNLDISPRTVEIYRANLMDKLEVRNLSQALRIAFAAGLIDLD